ncbi:hypothetical protein N7491_009968 [Penicillium cf. griseofulvum]|uniref:Uncharacterized protein n=1 Tax=Penicillium cf. griseofulvum TaxID=2972120 RepID=A0A9W9MYZ1_9EURO|nr:hypothetical protein N7472_000299 [Penicillium cf. griseofulvum]KAJ5421523.1 hypothetical protein N7491_009968 [Penicillium cf. griseofulvum]KAJ5424757.1 hypothetical protein N7445_010730 [Penicillium cf. griseofulvum]
MVKVRSEKVLIEATVQSIFSKAKIKETWKDTISKLQTIYLELARRDLTSPGMLRDKQGLEGALGLWLGHSINSITHTEYEPYDTYADRFADVGAASTRSLLLVRFFGGKAAQLPQGQDSKISKFWSAAIKSSLLTLYAQEVFVSFIASILNIVDYIGPIDVQEAEPLRLENSLVTDIIELFTKIQLGSR